ncbi:hypothetical protein M9458_031578, partial [Cirrhinus mrigala]
CGDVRDEASSPLCRASGSSWSSWGNRCMLSPHAFPRRLENIAAEARWGSTGA